MVRKLKNAPVTNSTLTELFFEGEVTTLEHKDLVRWEYPCRLEDVESEFEHGVGGVSHHVDDPVFAVLVDLNCNLARHHRLARLHFHRVGPVVGRRRRLTLSLGVAVGIRVVRWGTLPFFTLLWFLTRFWYSVVFITATFCLAT